MPSPEYYHRQADLCLRMALSSAQYEERLRLLDIANGYRASAVRVEALDASGAIQEIYATLVDGPNLLVKRLRPRQHVSQHYKRSIWRRDFDSKIIVPNRGLP